MNHNIKGLIPPDTLITFSSENDPLHHKCTRALTTLPLRIVKEHKEYLDRMIDSHTEEIDLFLPMNDLMPPGREDDNYVSERDVNLLEESLNNDSPSLSEEDSPNFDHHDDTSIPRPPPEPLDDQPTISEASRVRNGYIRNHKKTVKNGQARTQERKSVQKSEAKAEEEQSQIYSQLQEEAQVSLTWIASLAIRVRSLSDPTTKNKDLMIRDDQRWMIDGG
ncbi:hypothetical protein Tco_0241854 [Tanacetum coccineum]